jgi:DNA-binding protein H-NS
MGLKETTQHLKKLLEEINHDLLKASDGNKTASQRVRTNSIKFAKIAKQYRKESVAAEKGVKSKTAKKSAAKKTSPKKVVKAAKKRR